MERIVDVVLEATTEANQKKVFQPINIIQWITAKDKKSGSRKAQRRRETDGGRERGLDLVKS